jgi:hypothetical protein
MLLRNVGRLSTDIISQKIDVFITPAMRAAESLLMRVTVVLAFLTISLQFYLVRLELLTHFLPYSLNE